MADINNAEGFENLQASAAAQPKEQYKGTGRFVSAVGGLLTGVGAVVAPLAAAFGIEKLAKSTKLTNALFESPGVVKTKAAYIVGSVAILGGLVGLVKGWSHSNQGKKQLVETQTALEASQGQTLQLAELIGVEREQTKKFTDSILSKQQHGGHAASVHGDKTHEQPHHKPQADEVASEAADTGFAAKHDKHDSHLAAVEASQSEQTAHAM